jgi:predicted dinucleotide-binding enzyme
MTVGIIGAGSIGSTVARLAIAAGHDVVIANSRGPDTLKDLVVELGPKARAGTPAQAIAQGDLVVLAIPFRDRDSLFKSGVDFGGKIVVDAMNPFTPDFKVMDLGGRGSDARPKGSPERIVLPLAGDDAAAKRAVASFIDSVGYDPLDIGSLVDGRRQEPPGSVFSKPLTLAQAKAAIA